jgi:hypothetical protein
MNYPKGTKHQLSYLLPPEECVDDEDRPDEPEEEDPEENELLDPPEEDPPL